MTGNRSARATWNIAIAIVAALLLFRIHAAFQSTPDRRSDSLLIGTADSGEALLHRIRLDNPNAQFLSNHLPFLSLSTAVLFAHDGGLLSMKSACGLLFLATAGLLLALTFSATAPVVYALFFSFFSDKRALLDYPETAFSFLVLLAAGVLLWRARKPSERKSLVLGLAMGVTLLFRSTLVFFPPLLALYEWFFLYRRSLRIYWKHFLCLCVVPYLFLIPWAHMNWVVYRQFIPLEHHGADCNIVTGALGLVQTIEGDWRALIENRRFDGSWKGNVYAWAMRQVCRRPFRYAGAYLARIVYVLSLNPILFLLAFLALWTYRERNEFKQLGLLSLYFVCVYCVMSVQADYFMPLWPLAAILAGTLLDRFRPRRSLSIDPRLYRLARRFIGACLGAVLLLGLMTDMIVSSFVRRAELDPRTPETVLDGDVGRFPNDAWLILERARRRLKRGEASAAAADFSRGLALEHDADAELKLAWTKMLLGDPRPLFDWRLPPGAPAHNLEEITGPLLKAHGYSRLGRHEEARQELLAAIDSLKSRVYARGHTVLELETIEELRRDPLIDAHLLNWLRGLLASRPLQEKRDLLSDLAVLRPGSSRICRERAELAERAGDAKSARGLLALARELNN